MKSKQLVLYCTQLLILVSLLEIILLKPSVAQQPASNSFNTSDVEKHPRDQTRLNTPTQAHTLEQFKHWLRGQDPKALADYQRYIRQQVRHAPSLMALTHYAAVLPQHCQQRQFQIPKKSQWSSIVHSLQLLEKLHALGLFQHYEVVAVRGFDPDRCVMSAATRSKHATQMGNPRVYFKVLHQGQDHSHLSQVPSSSLFAALCQFWQFEGKQYRMGISLYSEQILHINRMTYQSWGKSRYTTVDCHASVHQRWKYQAPMHKARLEILKLAQQRSSR